MRKIYALLACALFLSFGAFASRKIIVAVLIVKPAIDTNVTTGSTVNPIYYFQNKSLTAADSIMVGDTIKYFTPGSSFSGSSYTSYEYVIASKTLFKDSIMAVNGLATPFASIVSLYDASKNFVAGPFANNTQYWWYLRPFAVTSKSTNPNKVDSFMAGTTDTQRIWINKGSGIVEFVQSASEDISIFPNPASNQVSFEYNFAANQNAIVKVLDLTGRTIIAKNYTQLSGQNKIDIDVNGVANGAYVLMVELENQKTLLGRFNIQK